MKIRPKSKKYLELLIIIVILLIAAFLRLYKIREFLIFLGDEGRDVLIVKRMIVDHKFTLLGPTASVGGFYLGPIYYYFMIPFLWLANLDPVGPAFMVALFGVANVMLFYLVNKEWFSTKAAILSGLLFATAPGVVMTTRSSWNPNIMPFFSLLTIYFLYLASKKHQLKWLFLSGVSLGISLQSHYLGLVLFPIVGVSLLLLFKTIPLFKSIISLALGFAVGFSMFLAFEIRHNFPNTRSVFEFVSRGGNTTGPRSLDIIWLLFEMFRRTCDAVFLIYPDILVRIIVAFLLLGNFAFLYLKWKENNLTVSMKLVLIWLVVGSLGIGFYKGQLYHHYFGFLFPLPFILIGLLTMLISKYKLTSRLFILGCTGLMIFNVYSLPIWGKGSNLINQTEKVTNKVIQMISNDPYNFALISSGNSDHAYRYFLEIKGKKPVLLEEQVTNQLIVVCEDLDNPCKPLGNPLWEIAGFGRAEIVDEQIVYPGIKVVKLIHHQDSLELIGKPAPKGG